MKISKADFRKILASFLIIVTFAYFWAITFCAIPKDNMDVSKTILGVLITVCITTIVSYYFGDSEKKE